MTISQIDKSLYRPCVGMVIFNPLGQVWLGRRIHQSGPYQWQFPQGGIDNGETAEYAAIRETEEETGISVQKLSPLAASARELYYDYPDNIKPTPRTKLWRGQRQLWFAARFNGTPKDVNLKAHKTQEFSEWRWGELSETPNLIVPFKRNVYEQLVIEFAPFAKPVN